MAEIAPSVDIVICREIAVVGSCTFDALIHRLPTYSWAQVFSAVDRLSRQGTLSVSRTRGVDSVVIHRPVPPIPESSQDQKCQAVLS
jgi:hypothetical protein